MNQILSTASPQGATPQSAAPQSIAEVRGALSFIRPQNTKPVFHSSALTGGNPEIFFEVEEHTVPIGDMREIADTLSIDREGFELLRHTTAVEDLYDDDAVDTQYYPEIEALLRQRFDADRVVIFDYPEPRLATLKRAAKTAISVKINHRILLAVCRRMA